MAVELSDVSLTLLMRGHCSSCILSDVILCVKVSAADVAKDMMCKVYCALEIQCPWYLNCSVWINL